MNDRKNDNRYNSRGARTPQRGHTTGGREGGSSRYPQRGTHEGYDHSYYEQREHDRSRLRRKSRMGCLVSIALLLVVLAGLYIIIFQTPLFGLKDSSLNASAEPSFTPYVASTPTPTPKPQPTEVPTPTPVPISSIGYIVTEDEDGTVRMRQEPNANSDIAGELHNREVLYLLEKTGDYYEIRHKGEVLYVHGDFVVEGLPEDNMLCDVVTFEIGYSKLVDVTEIIDDLIIEMPYATPSNHVNKQMYPFELVLLQEGTAYKLKKAQELFIEDGYSLVIWDAYRPYSVTYHTFSIIQNPLLAADPSKGSKHNRGAAIDVTLYNLNTDEYVDMPTEVREMDYDLAKRSSKSMTSEQRANMQYMEKILEQAGFTPYDGEWWHYNDMDEVERPVLDLQFEAWQD